MRSSTMKTAEAIQMATSGKVKTMRTPVLRCFISKAEKPQQTETLRIK